MSSWKHLETIEDDNDSDIVLVSAPCESILIRGKKSTSYLRPFGNSFYTLVGSECSSEPIEVMQLGIYHSMETIIICWKLHNVWVITFMRRLSKSLVRHSTGFIILLWFINERFKVFIHGRWTCLEEIAAWRLFNSLKATLLLQWHHKNTPERKFHYIARSAIVLFFLENGRFNMKWESFIRSVCHPISSVNYNQHHTVDC